MKSKTLVKSAVFLLFLGSLSGVQLNFESAAECSTSTTFQSGYVYIVFKDTSATCTWTVPSDAAGPR